MIFNINSDNDKRVLSRPLWFLDNILNNTFPFSNLDSKLKIHKFIVKNKIINNKKNENFTPSRLLCNTFWETVNWSLLKKLLNNKVNILDIGCGTGVYGKILDDLIPKGFNNYLGVDSSKKNEWGLLKKDKRYKFLEIDASKIEKYYNNPNVIISQSALEHFGFDAELLIKISKISKKNKSPLVQIHLVPSFPCLYTYLWHGYRQYSPRTISKIVKNFENINSNLYLLGNSSCNKTHFKWITIPEVLGKIKINILKNPKYTYIPKYVDSRNNAIQNGKNYNKPSFLALVLFSNIDLKPNDFLNK